MALSGSPPAIDLAMTENVRLYLKMLNGKHLSRPTKSRLNLIGNEEDPIILANLLKDLEILLRRDHKSSLSEDRFHDEGRNLF